MSTVKFTGRTEDEAVGKAADALGIDPTAVHYKIVARSGGLLGLLAPAITIEVTVGERSQPAPEVKRPEWRYEEEGEEARARRHEVEKAEEEPEARGKAEPEEAEVIEGEEAAAGAEAERGAAEQEGRRERGRPERGERPGGGERGGRRERGERGERGGRRERDERGERGERRDRGERGEERPRRRGEDEVESEVVDEAVFEKKQAHAREVVSRMLELLEAAPAVNVERKDAEIHVALAGKLPDWLGRTHNRAIEALQFVANKIVNRFPPRYRVVVAQEGMREAREKQIHEMAAELARKVAETGSPVWVLPMTAKERRVVHMVAAEQPDIATRSTGDGPSRRVCIEKKGE